MMRVGRGICAALLLALASACSTAVGAAGAQGIDCVSTDEATNRDGSTLRIRRDCNDAVEVAWAAPGSSRFRVVLRDPSPDPEERARSVAFIDLDEDGIHEVEATGMCGAGPNCAGIVYRLDPASGTFHEFFAGGYAELSILDGHVIEAGRASCCAWEFHAWPILPGPPPRAADVMALRIVVGMDGEHDTADCTFSRPRQSGDGFDEELVLPPGDAWLKICEHYGADYRVSMPVDAAAPPLPTDTNP
ncbi:hypothetical protein [Luteimonas yindakuii]|uniref:hypothetical protein n=1 Tax=Luteimonas yindakuii TaxID=2565782 RepID=UPI0010A48E5A|nr:hypothetical protein [Luteimonas yindakuii]